MDGRRESFYKHHKYKGMVDSRNSPPDNIIDENDPEELTISQFRNKYHHLRRVADGVSKQIIRENPGDEFFRNVYPEFIKFFSRGQLQRLEKLFLMSDQDRDGQLNTFEVKYLTEKLGRPTSQPEVKQIFILADENKDGYLSFREFLLFCQLSLTVQRMVDDPTGQSIKYPPRNSDDGVGEIVSKLKSFTQLKGNIESTVEYFENEIAKEIESTERNRQTYDALMEYKRGYSSSGTEKSTQSINRSSQNFEKPNYRASLQIQLAENKSLSLQQNQFKTSNTSQNKDLEHFPDKTSTFQSKWTSQDRVQTEPSQKYRTSIHLEPILPTTPQHEQTPITELEERHNSINKISNNIGNHRQPQWMTPHVSPHTYNISLPFLNETHPAKYENKEQDGRQKYSYPRGEQENDQKKKTLPWSSRQNGKCIPNSEKNHHRRNTISTSVAEESKNLKSASSSTHSKETHVVYAADPSLSYTSHEKLDLEHSESHVVYAADPSLSNTSHEKLDLEHSDPLLEKDTVELSSVPLPEVVNPVSTEIENDSSPLNVKDSDENREVEGGKSWWNRRFW